MCGSQGGEGRVPAEKRTMGWALCCPSPSLHSFPRRQAPMGTRFLRRSPWGHASQVTQALPFAVWSAPAESRTGRRYVLAPGASRGNPPPALGCGRSADSRSRYVSCEPGQAWRGAKPGAPPARVLIYLFGDSCVRRRRGPGFGPASARWLWEASPFRLAARWRF